MPPAVLIQSFFDDQPKHLQMWRDHGVVAFMAVVMLCGLLAVLVALLITRRRIRRRPLFDLNRPGSKPPKVPWQIGPVLRRADFERLAQETQAAAS
jgi:hypothetical protein